VVAADWWTWEHRSAEIPLQSRALHAGLRDRRRAGSGLLFQNTTNKKKSVSPYFDFLSVTIFVHQIEI
jgi:hypothetical protein